MLLDWSPQSKADLDRFFFFLLDKDPQAAINAIDLIEQGAEKITDNPEIGTAFNDGTARRIWRVFYGDSVYALHYIPDYDAGLIRILNIWHNKEDH